MTVALPEIARALQARYAGNVTIVGGDTSHNIPAAIAQILALAKSFGVEPSTDR